MKFCLCRRLYGNCVFTAHTKATLDLADELLSATRTPQFAANIAPLAGDFERTIAPYESAYFGAMSNGECFPSAYLALHLAAH